MKKTRNELPTFSPFFTAEEQRIREDYEWALHDAHVQRKYGGKIVVVYQKTILGVGRTYQTAWAAAQRRRGCPPKHEVAMPVVPYPFPAATS